MIYPKKSFIIRVDGGYRLGFGHIMRSLALAEELVKNEAEPVFVTRDDDHGKVASLLRGRNYRVRSFSQEADFRTDIQQTLEAARQHQTKGIIVDLSNSFFLEDAKAFADYLNALKTSGHDLAVIDGGTSLDCLSAKVKFFADAVFIPYFGAEEGKYQLNGATRLFLGAKYFIFGRQIQERALKPRTIQQRVENILVTMGGGSDAQGLTLQAVSALRQIPTALNINVVLGFHGCAGTEENVLKAAADTPHRVSIIKNASNMAELLYQADIAIVASGLTKYEAALLGTPLICLGPVPYVNFLPHGFEKQQLSLFLESRPQLNIEMIGKTIKTLVDDFPLRQEFSHNGKRLLDGNGARRTVDLLLGGA